MPNYTLFEVGVGNIDTCKSLSFANSDVECFCFEPIKEYCDRLVAYTQYNKINNIHVFNCCLYDYDGKVKIYDHLAASSIVGINNPSFQSRGEIESPEAVYVTEPTCKGVIEVDCYKVSRFDRGNIDALYIDTEGAEWFVLKHLISRPKLISVEVEFNGYINPYKNEIMDWMKYNGYNLSNKTESDFHFVKN